jgi:hypothetical protein
MWFWNGRQWTGPQSGCSPGCQCAPHPSNPPPNTPPFWEAVICFSNPGHKATKKGGKKPVVRIHHCFEEMELHVVHVPRRRRRKAK